MRVSMTATLPAAPTLGSMSIREHERALTVLDVPAGVACVDALWQPIDDALRGRCTIALVPEPSALTPAPMVELIRTAARLDAPISEDIAVVVSTSGSTGQPRGVCLTADALTCMSEHVNELAGGDPTWVLAIPATSIGGLNVLIRARATGQRPIALPSLGGAERFTVALFASGIERALQVGRPVAVSLVPPQLPRLLASKSGREALAACAVVLVGGATLTPQAARECRAAGINVVTTYGMTETSGGCVLDGRPLPGVRIRVQEPDGRIFVSGPMLARGYRDGEVIADGWLRTHDRGRWVDEHLEILGRLDDVVLVQGVNVDLVAIEDRVIDHPRVTSAIALAVAEEPGARIHVVYVGEAITHEELRTWVCDKLGTPAAPSATHRVDGLAMTASGKIDRRANAALLGLELAGDQT